MIDHRAIGSLDPRKKKASSMRALAGLLFVGKRGGIGEREGGGSVIERYCQDRWLLRKPL